jgi:hypothetical protein
MCVNLQWQLCAVQGKLPNQGSRQISFATAPKDLMVGWWEDPQNNPIMGKWIAFGCCAPDRFSVADVFFAECAAHPDGVSEREPRCGACLCLLTSAHCAAQPSILLDVRLCD